MMVRVMKGKGKKYVCFSAKDIQKLREHLLLVSIPGDDSEFNDRFFHSLGACLTMCVSHNNYVSHLLNGERDQEIFVIFIDDEATYDIRNGRYVSLPVGFGYYGRTDYEKLNLSPDGEFPEKYDFDSIYA